VPRPSAEDEFLHLLMHNLLGKKALQDKHVGRLRELHARGLDTERLDDQARVFGVRSEVRAVRDRFESLVTDPAAWRRLRRRIRFELLLVPMNVIGALRYAYADMLRWRRRAVVLALLGPDGSGKTSFADALEALLRDGPLRAGRVYMGCWGHDLLPMRNVRRLVPPQASPLRLFLRRCGVAVSLTPEEERLAAGPGRSIVGLALAAIRYAGKVAVFHLALGLEMTCRYVRYVWLSRRPIVIADRWVYDLEFRQGKVPFVHGARLRRLLFRAFPAPDGVLYLKTPYDLVERRKPQLDRDQFETMDRVFQRLLHRQQPLEITSDAPPEDLARAFLTRHWGTILQRCNRRA
jgi:thymidylate kinase